MSQPTPKGPQSSTRWDCEAIKALLDRSPEARLKALKWLWGQQTSVERSARMTTEHNSVGFTGIDAPTLSAIAQYAERHAWQPLLPGQDAVLRSMIGKYWRQLLLPIAAKAPEAVLKVTKSSITLGATSHG